MTTKAGAGGESLTRRASIEVVGWAPGADPMWVEARHAGWPGYVFRLTFTAGELMGVEVRRDGSTAAPLTAHLLQRVPLGRRSASRSSEVNVFETLWQEVVDSTVGLSGDKVVPTVKAGMAPAVAEWFDAYAEGGRPSIPTANAGSQGLRNATSRPSANADSRRSWPRSSTTAGHRSPRWSTKPRPPAPLPYNKRASGWKPDAQGLSSAYQKWRKDGQATRQQRGQHLQGRAGFYRGAVTLPDGTRRTFPPRPRGNARTSWRASGDHGGGSATGET